MFKKVLVANRGEIAVRVLRALRQLGIRSAAVYSEVDRNALHVRMADEAYAVGPAASSQSYLNIGRLVEAALRCGAQAVHPGYGFLSENAEFAAACETAGLVFIGPGAASIRALGLKTEARQIARRAGVASVPGTEDPVLGLDRALSVARDIGYPVMLKAAAGGGGKGMRRVMTEQDLAAALRDASAEAESAFRDASVYLEKLILRPRHIEVQVFGDHHGNMIHLGERECSLQRRHQKVIEECPSPFVARHPGLRERMGEAAVTVARAAGYSNAGTVEFLVDEQANFYFLEMNTRLQVEHPVTEMVTGLDLVEMQLRVASGEPLPLRQQDVAWRGSAVECRIYAEDPERGFFPSPGRITRWSAPSGPGIRLDSGVYPGWTVPMEYDPMLAKLAAWGATRDQAAARLRTALDEFEIAGIRTNVRFFAEVLRDRQFLDGALHTGFVDEFFGRRVRPAVEEEAKEAAALAARELRRRVTQASPPADGSRWRSAGRAEILR